MKKTILIVMVAFLLVSIVPLSFAAAQQPSSEPVKTGFFARFFEPIFGPFFKLFGLGKPTDEITIAKVFTEKEAYLPGESVLIFAKVTHDGKSLTPSEDVKVTAMLVDVNGKELTPRYAMEYNAAPQAEYWELRDYLLIVPKDTTAYIRVDVSRKDTKVSTTESVAVTSGSTEAPPEEARSEESGLPEGEGSAVPPDFEGVPAEGGSVEGDLGAAFGGDGAQYGGDESSRSRGGGEDYGGEDIGEVPDEAPVDEAEACFNSVVAMFQDNPHMRSVEQCGERLEQQYPNGDYSQEELSNCFRPLQPAFDQALAQQCPELAQMGENVPGEAHSQPPSQQPTPRKLSKEEQCIIDIFSEYSTRRETQTKYRQILSCLKDKGIDFSAYAPPKLDSGVVKNIPQNLLQIRSISKPVVIKTLTPTGRIIQLNVGQLSETMRKAAENVPASNNLEKKRLTVTSLRSFKSCFEPLPELLEKVSAACKPAAQGDLSKVIQGAGKLGDIVKVPTSKTIPIQPASTPLPKIPMMGTPKFSDIALSTPKVVTPSSCVDKDNDGYGTGCQKGKDCDDNNANVHSNCPSRNLPSIPLTSLKTISILR